MLVAGGTGRLAIGWMPSTCEFLGRPSAHFFSWNSLEEPGLHHYPFHIGDYRAATAHLSNEEDLAYRRLLDWYYDTEVPIPLETDSVCRRLRLETDVVSAVLADMFVRRDDGWHHPRCDEEIARYHARASKARANGSLGGRPTKKLSVSPKNRMVSERKLTKNQEPRTSTQVRTPPAPPRASARVTTPDRPDDVTAETWADWLAVRQGKRAKVTQTAVKRARTEAEKAGITLEEALNMAAANGWQSFQAHYVNRATNGVAANRANRPPGFRNHKPEDYGEAGVW